MDKNPNAKKDGRSTERKLAFAWCLWEKYQEAFVQNAANFDKNIHIIYAFDSLESFALLWKYTTYKRPSALFFDLENNMQKKFKVGEDGMEDEKVVDGLFLFKNGVYPKWEDEANIKGCSISCELHNLSPGKIDSFWQDIVFAVVGQDFPFSSCVNGFRLLDRMRKHQHMKFELWMSCGVGAYKPGSPEYNENNKRVSEIIAFTHALIYKTQEVSVHSLIKKEHFISSKVN